MQFEPDECHEAHPREEVHPGGGEGEVRGGRVNQGREVHTSVGQRDGHAEISLMHRALSV